MGFETVAPCAVEAAAGGSPSGFETVATCEALEFAVLDVPSGLATVAPEEAEAVVVAGAAPTGFATVAACEPGSTGGGLGGLATVAA
jgi:hypothetical protein